MNSGQDICIVFSVCSKTSINGVPLYIGGLRSGTTNVSDNDVLSLPETSTAYSSIDNSSSSLNFETSIE